MIHAIPAPRVMRAARRAVAAACLGLCLAALPGRAQAQDLFAKDLAAPADIAAAHAVAADDGGLRLQAVAPTTLHLATLDDPDVESAIVAFSARLRTQDLKGQAYLEMLCRFPGKGEFFSRGLNMPLSGTTGWTNQTIPFYLNAGENPDRILLNLVVTGPGLVWIDDLAVRATPWTP